MGVVGPVIFLYEEFTLYGIDGHDLELVPFVGLAAGMWGAACGVFSGALCALLTSTSADRSSAGAHLYKVTAAVVTGVVLLVFALGIVSVDAAGSGSELLVWIVFPLAVASSAAWLVGGWVWRRTAGRGALVGGS
jgi:hypothetical protein